MRLILRESVGLLARERLEAFEAHIKKLAKKGSLNPTDWDALDFRDPASQILELKICDPAMGSGHFLVALVDDLADRVLEAITTATHWVNEQPWAAHLAESGRPWQSPVLARMAHIRRSIKITAKDHGWAVTDAQLDDRHIVRRMILKKTIFGVDKNPMAVERSRETVQRRNLIFSTLMATRQARVSLDHVRALNSIDLAFYGRRMLGRAWRTRRSQAVLDAWHDYHAHLSLPAEQRPKTEADRRDWDGRGDELFTNLLDRVASATNFKFERVQLKGGSYSPEAHGTVELEQQAMRRLSIEVLAQ